MAIVCNSNDHTPVDATGKVLVARHDSGYERVIDAYDELFHPFCACDYVPATILKSKEDSRTIILKCWITEDCPCEDCDAPRPLLVASG